jgi:putative hydrolase of the HAD superfamily
MRAVRVVLFDLGGVLVEVAGVTEMLRWVGPGLDEEGLWRRWLHSPAVRAFETGRSSADEFAREVIGELALPVEPEEFLASFAAWPRGLLPGAADLVRRIRAHVVRASLSNTSAMHWPRLCGEFGLAELIEHHFPSHLTRRIKPDAEAFEHAVAALDCEPAAVLFIDDNVLNVEAARRCGLQAERAQGPAQAEKVLRARGVLDKDWSIAGGQLSK